MASKWPTDDDGNLIDPPVLPDYEQRLAAAHAAGDQDEIQVVQDDYTKAQVKRAAALDKRSSGDEGK